MAYLEKVKPKGASVSDTIDTLKVKLTDALRENQELKSKLSGAEKITVGQGKALKAIELEHEYVNKINILTEALRVEKDKVSKLREANRNFDRSGKMQVERMVKLEEELRKYRASGK